MSNKEQATGCFVERTLSGKVDAGDANFANSAHDQSDRQVEFFRGGIGRTCIQGKVALGALVAQRLNPGKTVMTQHQRHAASSCDLGHWTNSILPRGSIDGTR